MGLKKQKFYEQLTSFSNVFSSPLVSTGPSLLLREPSRFTNHRRRRHGPFVVPNQRRQPHLEKMQRSLRHNESATRERHPNSSSFHRRQRRRGPAVGARQIRRFHAASRDAQRVQVREIQAEPNGRHFFRV